MAHRYPYQNSAQMLYWPAHGPKFFDGWERSDMTNHDLLCAEMCRLAYADRKTVSTVLDPLQFNLQHWIGGETAEQRGATRGTDGLIASSRDGRVTILAFRGTESNKPEDILTDAMARSEPWSGHGQVHRGFARAYGLVRDGIHESLAATRAPLLLITGHSLGAGLATLAAADLDGQRMLITFGSPRVGDADFRQRLAGVTTIHRVVDCCDLVARIPPARFDEAHIQELLDDLIPDGLRSTVIARSLIRTAAAALGGALAALGIQPEYEHVGDAVYRDREGKPLPAETATADDQREARNAYDAGRLLPDVGHLMRELVEAVLAALAARDAETLRRAIRDFAARLFQGDPVPLRDLADHAPINYVSLFTGRV